VDKDAQGSACNEAVLSLEIKLLNMLLVMKLLLLG
jgi:hypothetical protein